MPCQPTQEEPDVVPHSPPSSPPATPSAPEAANKDDEGSHYGNTDGGDEDGDYDHHHGEVYDRGDYYDEAYFGRDEHDDDEYGDDQEMSVYHEEEEVPPYDRLDEAPAYREREVNEDTRGANILVGFIVLFSFVLCATIYDQSLLVGTAYAELGASISNAHAAFNQLENIFTWASLWNRIGAADIIALVLILLVLVLEYNGPFYTRWQRFRDPHLCARFAWLARACKKSYPNESAGCCVLHAAKVFIVLSLMAHVINKIRDLVDSVGAVFGEINNVMGAMGMVSKAATKFYWQAAATSTTVVCIFLFLLGLIGLL